MAPRLSEGSRSSSLFRAALSVRPMKRFPPVVSFLCVLAMSGAALAAERVPWTSSQVHGSPEKPAPYRVERVFPRMTFDAQLERAVQELLAQLRMPRTQAGSPR